MSNQNDLTLPDMTDAILGPDDVAALFRDYRACTGAIKIQVKSGPGLVAAHAPPTLDEAQELLLSHGARGLQLRYSFGGSEWCDTLMPVSSGFRLVRIKA
jgi:hypothetical protein